MVSRAELVAQLVYEPDVAQLDQIMRNGSQRPIRVGTCAAQ
jgi:hypothetical protein